MHLTIYNCPQKFFVKRQVIDKPHNKRNHGTTAFETLDNYREIYNKHQQNKYIPATTELLCNENSIVTHNGSKKAL